MGGAFPEIAKNPDQIADVLKDEEQLFGRTLDRGIALFDEAAERGGKAISGDDAFELYATYGFPLDLTQLMADERGMTVDTEAFEQRFAEHKQISKGEGEGAGPTQSLVEIVQRSDLPATKFVGYDQMLAEHASLVGMYVLRDQQYEQADDLQVGQRGALVVDTTPFYAEAGGQVGDTGRIHTTAGSVFRVEDVQKIGDVFFHLGELESGSIQTGRPAFTTDDSLMLEVDVPRRQQIMSHHTATHVLNHKLRAVLGDHVQQKGSLVDHEKTRFDFAHNKAVDTGQIEKIEAMVSADIRANLPVSADYADQDDALKINGLRAVFGEKYPPKVRVVSIGVEPDELLADPQREQWMDYSIEFCGGTHVEKTGQIGDFALTSEEAVAKGVRRVVGVCGELASEARSNALTLFERIDALDTAKPEALTAAVSEITELLNNQVLPLADRAKIRSRLEELQKKVKAHQKAQSQAAAGQVVDVARQIAQEQDGPVIVAHVPGADGGTLRKAMDVIRKTRPESAMFLAAADDQKVALLAAVPQPMIDQGLKAGDWVKQVAPVVDGGGGGRPDMAQAGGKDPRKLDEALEAARQYAAEKLG
jgi:alanyl-tRNA synthetase